MEKGRKAQIVLKKLSLSEAHEFCNLRAYPEEYGRVYQEYYSTDETPEEFTKRMLWLNKCIYTIRLKSNPKKIIGACFLYKSGKLRKDTYLGGTLLPEHRGKGLLYEAFNEVLEIANYFYGIFEVKVVLNALNEQALYFIRKLGFSKEKGADETIYTKVLRRHTPQRDDRMLYLY